jgi:hypothetical protein
MRRFLLLLIGMFSPGIAYAQKHLSDYGFDCTKIEQYGLTIPGCDSPIDLTVAATAKVAGTGLAIAAPLATVVFLYGAIRMVISRGDEGKEVGKKAMIYGALGLIFVTLAFGIVTMVKAYLYLL